jgi:PD-(D/E)XK nuclease superfamily
MNSPLPPLPLVDNCLFIDNSAWMEGLATCTRALQYKSLNQRISAAEKPSLNFGSAIHLAMEYRYKTYQNRPVDQDYYNNLAVILTDFFNLHQPQDGDWRNLNWCMEVIKKYNERFSSEEFLLLIDRNTSLPMVELPFIIPLYQHKEIKVMYTGRIDLPISLDSQIFVMDHKTTSMMGSQFFDEMRRSAQQKGYAWAFSELTGQKVSGYIINGIRTKEVPQYVLKQKDFKAKDGKVCTSESWWQENFSRERYLLKSGDLEEWKNNTIDILEEFFFHYERGYMPQKTVWCVGKYGKCPYYDVCQLAPEDRGVYLASGLFTNNEWSPLNLQKQTPSQPKQ